MGAKKTLSDCFLISDSYDLRDHRAVYIAGTVAPEILNEDMQGSLICRPREPLKAEKGRELPDQYPAGLKALYNIAAADMRKQGIDPDTYDLYVLYHAGDLEPGTCLREGHWHFDLLRLLRADTPEGTLAVGINYTVCDVVPTELIAELKSEAPLKARETMADQMAYDAVAAGSLKEQPPFTAQSGEVVRYDTVTLHRAGVNRSQETVHRSFFHLSFCPPV